MEESEVLIAKLRADERSRTLYRRLSQYGVAIYPAQFAALHQAGALELLPDGSAALLDLTQYHPAFGLKLDENGHEWSL